MKTEEMINNFTSMFTWNEPGITNYFCAFYTHHRIGINNRKAIEQVEEVTGYILATKFCDTTDFPHKFCLQSHQKYRKSSFYTGYFLSQVREGGRTVGLGRVATIIE